MLKAVLSPCCNCHQYWTVVILDGQQFVETRNVRAATQNEAIRALNNYVSRRYGEALALENIAT